MKKSILTFRLIICFLFFNIKVLPAQFPITPEDIMAYNNALTQTPLTAKSHPPFYSLKNFAPTPEDQRKIPACVPTAFAHAYSILINQSFGWDLNNDNCPVTQSGLDSSAISGIFNYVRAILTPKLDRSCKEFLSFTEVIKIFETMGSCLRTQYNISPYYNPKKAMRPCYPVFTDSIRREALNYRLKNVSKVFHTNDIGKPLVIKNIKNFLLNKKPVIIGIKLPKKHTRIINSEAILTIPSNPTPSFNHAVVITGFRVNDDQESYFEIMDSHGASLGKNGFWWIKATDLSESLIFGYVIDLLPRNKSLKTSFSLIDPIYKKPYRFVGTFNKSNNEYTYKKNWKPDLLRFRTSINNIRKDNHVYKLFYDGTKFKIGDTTIAKMEKEPISLPLNAGMSDTIGKKGDHYFIFLYTYQKIEINDIIAQLNKTNEPSIYQALQKVIGEDLVTDIEYNPKEITCKVSDIKATSIKGNVIPVIIKFEE